MLVMQCSQRCCMTENETCCFCFQNRTDWHILHTASLLLALSSSTFFWSKTTCFSLFTALLDAGGTWFWLPSSSIPISVIAAICCSSNSTLYKRLWFYLPISVWTLAELVWAIRDTWEYEEINLEWCHLACHITEQRNWSGFEWVH